VAETFWIGFCIARVHPRTSRPRRRRTAIIVIRSAGVGFLVRRSGGTREIVFAFSQYTSANTRRRNRKLTEDFKPDCTNLGEMISRYKDRRYLMIISPKLVLSKTCNWENNWLDEYRYSYDSFFLMKIKKGKQYARTNIPSHFKSSPELQILCYIRGLCSLILYPCFL